MLCARANLSVRSHIRSLVLVILMTIPRYNPSAYNVNSRNFQVFSDPVPASSHRRSSYFGFSVALYTNRGGRLLLVGAPRANSTASRTVNEPGTVFACTMYGRCSEWMIDGYESVNSVLSYDRRVIQVKDNAWIGASIAVENKPIAKVVVRCRLSSFISQ